MHRHTEICFRVAGLVVVAGCAPKTLTSPEQDRTPRPSSAEREAVSTVPVAPVREIEVKEQRWPSGALASRTEGFVDEEAKFVRHGVAAEWYENGQQKLEIHWKDGVQHGARDTWYENGQPWGQGAYTEGREDGIWTAWWPNGFKSMEWTMRDGAFHGMYTEWHSNGEKRRVFEYINGVKQGPVTYWDEEGEVQFRGEYVDDVLQP